MNNYIKPDSEYRQVNTTSQLTRKGYELIVYPNGNRSYYLDGQLHRENAPAVIHMDGHQEWKIRGKLHKLTGPSIVRSNGHALYYIDNKYYDENYFWIIQKNVLNVTKYSIISMI